MRTIIATLFAGAVLLGAPLAGHARAPARRAAVPAPATPAAPAAVAAPAAPAASTNRVQRLTFDDDYVTGRRDLGDGDVIRISGRVKHSNLVRPRADFFPELIKSAEDI